MNTITTNDIKNIAEYEKIRPVFRSNVIEEKKIRRLHLGDKMTIVFENRNSVLFQIQEMMRVERIVDDAAIAHEVATYSQLLPSSHTISGTLLIDIGEKELIKPVLDSLVGLGKGHFFLETGGKRIEAVFDEGQAEDDRISAVQYVKWNLDDDTRAAFLDPKQRAALVCTHPNYSFDIELPAATRQAVIADISEPV